ncbi:structural toxin protein [Teratosphaeria destructans]|uniref:ATP phosphoribosyltransferase n=1 Tax=Teratosphaeria destructans TaxID=418781 RepID=A0A9W7W3E2_9PEZI|nr:structural toxin protein [Teratosphaeria destructans]
MTSTTPEKFKLIFYTPPTSLPTIKAAIFATGAGTYSKYTECCFTTHGTGQFRPSAEAKPHLGRPGDLAEVEEARCEILCVGREVTRQAVRELKRTHPYEEVAYEVLKVEDF